MNMFCYCINYELRNTKIPFAKNKIDIYHFIEGDFIIELISISIDKLFAFNLLPNGSCNSFSESTFRKNVQPNANLIEISIKIDDWN